MVGGDVRCLPVQFVSARFVPCDDPPVSGDDLFVSWLADLAENRVAEMCHFEIHHPHDRRPDEDVLGRVVTVHQAAFGRGHPVDHSADLGG